MRPYLLALLAPCVLMGAHPCRPSEAFEKFRLSLPADRLLRLSIIEDRLQKEPDNVLLNRLYLESGVYWRKPVRERYALLRQRHKGDLEYEYLYARSLLGSNSAEALRLFKAILEKDPAYPWVHIPMMEIYRSDKMKDPAALRASFEAFTKLCPKSLAPFEYLRHVEDVALAAASGRRLRELLANAEDAETLGLYATLWTAEFRITPKLEHEALRARISEDLRRLKASSHANDPVVRRALYSAARLLGDKQLESESRVRDRLDYYQDWMRQNPRTPATAPHELLQTWAKALAKEAAKWRELYPGDILGRIERLNALVLLDDTSPDEIERAANEVLEFDRRHPHASFSPGTHRVAQAFVRRGLFLDRVPALITETIDRLSDPEQMIEIDIYPNNRTARNRMMMVEASMHAWQTLVDACLKQNDTASTHPVLRSMEDYLSAKAPAADEKNQMVLRAYGTAESYYHRTKAMVAEREGRKLDALLSYRQAQTALGVPLPDWLASQSRLWKELGGTPQGWQDWADSFAAKPWSPPQGNRTGWTKLDRPLPAFSLKDLDGNDWTLESLKGKKTFVNVWATWCGPCREELPYVQELADRLKDRPDLQVLTFSVDENPGVLEPFLKPLGFRFPVLLAKFYVDSLVESLSIPRNWIIGPDGVLLKEQLGFGRTDIWIEEVLRELQ